MIVLPFFVVKILNKFEYILINLSLTFYFPVLTILCFFGVVLTMQIFDMQKGFSKKSTILSYWNLASDKTLISNIRIETIFHNPVCLLEDSLHETRIPVFSIHDETIPYCRFSKTETCRSRALDYRRIDHFIQWPPPDFSIS